MKKNIYLIIMLGSLLTVNNAFAYKEAACNYGGRVGTQYYMCCLMSSTPTWYPQTPGGCKGVNPNFHVSLQCPAYSGPNCQYIGKK